MEMWLPALIAVVITLFFTFSHLKNLKRMEKKALESAEKGKLHSSGPQSQHPHIDNAQCIGCATCTMVCPEGDVLAVLGGKAVIVNGYKCIGHGLCADACPVGAITMVMASPSMGADMPNLTPEHETSIANLFIVGELGGLALIKNAINQGRDCIDTIVRRGAVTARAGSIPTPDIYDVVIVGAGPAGISASLRATEKKLKYVTIDEGEIGGTVAKYPRQKLVMTSPVEFPLYGKFKRMELSKEELISFWHKVLGRTDFNFRSGEKVQDIKKEGEDVFTIVTSKGEYRSHAVILAIGKSGSPRKLGIKGEDLPKVMYRLIEADHYVNKRILVVGGGDSAVEAAMGLAHQIGNQVTLSYRKAAFSRLKERNAQRIEECIRKGKLTVMFNSEPVEFREGSAILERDGQVVEIPNEYVWIFAGGEPPTAFLKKIGVALGMHDMTAEGSTEAHAAVLAKKNLVTAAVEMSQ
jgi:thioredoxin reductase (NADPH)